MVGRVKTTSQIIIFLIGFNIINQYKPTISMGKSPISMACDLFKNSSPLWCEIALGMTRRQKFRSIPGERSCSSHKVWPHGKWWFNVI